MRAVFLPCAVCGATETERLFSAFHRGEWSAIAAIVICRECGLVYRNPHVPDLYSNPPDSVEAWSPFQAIYEQRFERIAGEIASRVSLDEDELYLHVGCGPGWLAERLARTFSPRCAVLLEPGPNLASYAKLRNPEATVLPSRLDEAELPSGAFSLVVACGADYLLQNHRRDIGVLLDLLCDGGVLYIETSTFVDSRALANQVDIEEMFGLNPWINAWFGREQFVDYLREFFDVVDVIEYTVDSSPSPLSRSNRLTGAFCRKRTNGARAVPRIVNRYAGHMAALRELSMKSSLEDLKTLANARVRRVIICGCGPEARALATLIKTERLFSIAGFVTRKDQAAERDALTAEFADVDASKPTDIILVASIEHQEQYVAEFQAMGYGNVLPCFRRGIDRFWSDGATAIQMKAFLPGLLRAHQERSVEAQRAGA